MRSRLASIALPCLIITATACGKSAIDTAQAFVPNKLPHISDIAFALPAGVTADTLGNNMTIRIAITASDPENRLVQCLITSTQGTAGNIIATETGYTAEFITTAVTGGTAVVATITVRDEKGASDTWANHEIGKGRTKPTVILDDAPANLTREYMKPTEDTQFVFSCASKGYYQVIADNAATESTIAIRQDDPIFMYTPSEDVNNPKLVTVSIAGLFSTNSGKVKLTEDNAPNYVWLLFWDGLDQLDIKKFVINQDSLPPVVQFKADGVALGANARVRSSSVITAEAVDGGSVLTPELNAASSTALRAGKYTASTAGPVLTITPQSDFALGAKSFSVSAVDEAGNTATGSISLNFYTLDYYVSSSTGSDSNAGFRDEPLETIQAAVTAITNSITATEVMNIHVEEGTFNNTVSAPIINADLSSISDSSIRFLGGYQAGSSFSNRNPKQFISILSNINTCNTAIYLKSSGSSNAIDGFQISNASSTSIADSIKCIYIQNTRKVSISNCNIKGSYAPLNTILFAGIYLVNSSAKIYNNIIFSTTTTNINTRASGIEALYSTVDNHSLVIINNAITGATMSSSSTYATNCIRTSATAPASTQIEIFIRNNTLNSGRGYYNGSDRAVFLNPSVGHTNTFFIDNNIIFRHANRETASYSYCFPIYVQSDYDGSFDDDNPMLPNSAKNNYVFNYDCYAYGNYCYPIYHWEGYNYNKSFLTIAPFDTALGNPAGSNKYFSGGVPSSLFADYTNFNYTLLTPSTDISSGGLSGNSEGWTDFPKNASGQFCDILGNPRPTTGGWSIGAYQAQ